MTTISCSKLLERIIIIATKYLLSVTLFETSFPMDQREHFYWMYCSNSSVETESYILYYPINFLGLNVYLAYSKWIYFCMLLSLYELFLQKEIMKNFPIFFLFFYFYPQKISIGRYCYYQEKNSWIFSNKRKQDYTGIYVSEV